MALGTGDIVVGSRALSLIFNRKKPVEIGELVLDAALQETHDFQNDITQYPIENGADISDHIISQPEKISINGFVTNSPVTFTGRLEVAKNLFTRKTRIDSAFEILQNYYRGHIRPDGSRVRVPIDIVTGLKVYTSMIMTRLIVPKNNRTGETLQFTADFQKISFVSSEVVIVEDINPANITQASPKVEKGKQQTKKASKESESRISFFKGVVKSIKAAGRKLIKKTEEELL